MSYQFIPNMRSIILCKKVETKDIASLQEALSLQKVVFYKQKNFLVSDLLKNYEINLLIQQKENCTYLLIELNPNSIRLRKRRILTLSYSPKAVSRFLEKAEKILSKILPYGYCSMEEYTLENIAFTHDILLPEADKEFYLNSAELSLQSDSYKKSLFFNDRKRNRVNPKVISFENPSMILEIYDKKRQIKKHSHEDIGILRVKIQFKKNWIAAYIKYQQKHLGLSALMNGIWSLTPQIFKETVMKIGHDASEDCDSWDTFNFQELLTEKYDYQYLKNEEKI